jgi:RNA polymerase sigma-70 factor (ECF subfamily)
MTLRISETGDSVIDPDTLFRRYSRELNNYAYRRLKDREAAADVVQDGFLRFLVWSRDGNEAALPNGTRFFLWRVVGNLTIDLVRRNRILGPLAQLDDVADRLVDPAPTPDRCLEARQQYLLLKAALDELPERHRTALLLNRIDGLTHAEIGTRLGVSASMVSKYIMAVLEHCLDRMPNGLR